MKKLLKTISERWRHYVGTNLHFTEEIGVVGNSVQWSSFDGKEGGVAYPKLYQCIYCKKVDIVVNC